MSAKHWAFGIIHRRTHTISQCNLISYAKRMPKARIIHKIACLADIFITHTQTNSRIAHTVNIILLEKEQKKCILNALNHSMLSSFLFLIQRRRKRSILPLHSGTENKTHKSAFTHTNHGKKIYWYRCLSLKTKRRIKFDSRVIARPGRARDGKKWMKSRRANEWFA